MRRKLAAVLCTLLCLTAFTGCSADEVGYLQMSVDMLKGMEVSETTGEAEITLDFDAMKTFAADAMLASGMTQEDVDTAMAGMTDFDGKKNVKLEYTMLMNMDDMSFMFDVDATCRYRQLFLQRCICAGMENDAGSRPVYLRSGHERRFGSDPGRTGCPDSQRL